MPRTALMGVASVCFVRSSFDQCFREGVSNEVQE
jgi:hypothetical protein